MAASYSWTKPLNWILSERRFTKSLRALSWGERLETYDGDIPLPPETVQRIRLGTLIGVVAVTDVVFSEAVATWVFFAIVVVWIGVITLTLLDRG
jgi:hypothetical protein